jgi:hypothetical protein
MKTNQWIKVIVLLLVLLALVVSCAPAANKAMATPAPQSRADRAAPAAAAPGAPAQAKPVATAAASTAASEADTAARMIIRNATITVIVEDTDKTVDALNALIKARGGYSADSRRWYEGEQPLAQLTLRVPADKLDEVLDQIRAMVLKVETENVSGQDVTDQYTDNAARLRNLEATEKELLALLTQVRENGGKAEDILAVYRELTTIRGQIETIKGRQLYYERMTALATIQITIRPKQAPQPLVEKETWDPLITLNRALRAFVAFVQVLINVAIYLIVFGFLPALVVIIIWVAVRRSQRRKAAKKPDTTPKS